MYPPKSLEGSPAGARPPPCPKRLSLCQLCVPSPVGVALGVPFAVSFWLVSVWFLLFRH